MDSQSSSEVIGWVTQIGPIWDGVARRRPSGSSLVFAATPVQ